jgi:quercetin dioxygenase-like cupin family protein
MELPRARRWKFLFAQRVAAEVKEDFLCALRASGVKYPFYIDPLKECLREDEMKIVKVSQVPKESSAGPLFTGPDVTRQVLVPDSKEFNVNVVNFGKGVRNKFHSHDGEQILIITAGKGIVATEKEEKVVTPGDVILFAAGEKHWHGAAKDSEFSHIYVSRMGNKLTQLEE